MSETDTVVRLINPLPRTHTPNAYIIRTNGSKKEIDSASNVIFSQMSRYILTGGKYKDAVVRFQVEAKQYGGSDAETITYEGKISEKENSRRLKIKRITTDDVNPSTLKLPLGGDKIQSGGAILSLPPLYDVSTSFLWNLPVLGPQSYIDSYLSSVVFPASYYPAYNIAYWNALGYYSYPEYAYIPTLSVLAPTVTGALSSTTNPSGSSTGTGKTNYSNLG